MSTGAAKPETRKIEMRVIDRPDLVETFADVVGALSFDGNTLRLEFLAARIGAGAAGQAILPAIDWIAAHCEPCST